MVTYTLQETTAVVLAILNPKTPYTNTMPFNIAPAMYTLQNECCQYTIAGSIKNTQVIVKRLTYGLIGVKVHIVNTAQVTRQSVENSLSNRIPHIHKPAYRDY